MLFFLIFVFMTCYSKTAISAIYIETIYIIPHKWETKKEASQYVYEQVIAFLDKISGIENGKVNLWMVVSGSNEEMKLMTEANKQHRPPQENEKFYARAGRDRKVCLTTSVIKTKYMEVLLEFWALVKVGKAQKLREATVSTWVIPVQYEKTVSDQVELVSDNIQMLYGQMLTNSDDECNIYFLFSDDYNNLLYWSDDIGSKRRKAMDDFLRQAIDNFKTATADFDKESQFSLEAGHGESSGAETEDLSENLNCLAKGMASASINNFPHGGSNQKHMGLMVKPETCDAETMTDFELPDGDRYRALECPICFCRLPGIPVTTGCCNIDVCSFSDLLRRRTSCPYGCGDFREFICFPRGIKDFGKMRVLIEDGKCLSIIIKIQKGRYYTDDYSGVRHCYQYEKLTQHFYLPPYNSKEKRNNKLVVKIMDLLRFIISFESERLALDLVISKNGVRYFKVSDGLLPTTEVEAWKLYENIEGLMGIHRKMQDKFPEGFREKWKKIISNESNPEQPVL